MTVILVGSPRTSWVAAARASGLKRDVRKTHPSGYYRFVHLPISVWSTGDVAGARRDKA